MGKYGKLFRAEQISNFEQKYMDYKALKQFIKKNVSEKQPLSKQELIKQFITLLDKELKKVYIFYVAKERELYIEMNMRLHHKENYFNLTPSEIEKELNELYKVSIASNLLMKYIVANLIALYKILKKFDKKFKQFNMHLSDDYIVAKLKLKSSDLFYLLEFKLIDEVNVLLNHLTSELVQSYTLVKKHLLKNGDQQNLIQDNEVKDSQIYDKQKAINEKLNEIEETYAQTVSFHNKWKEIFQQSEVEGTDNASPLNKENDYFDMENQKSIRNKKVLNVISKENQWNLTLTLMQKIYIAICCMFILPNNYTTLLFDFKQKDAQYYSAIAIAMTPLGGIFSIIITSYIITKTYKIPMIISSILCILGNCSYTIAIALDNIILLCISRLFIGFALNIRVHRNYLLDFLPKKHISNYMLALKICTLIGNAFGPFFTFIFTFLGTTDKKEQSISKWLLFDQYSVPSWILSFGAIFMFIIIIIFYIEPVDMSFNAYGDGESPASAIKRMGSFTMDDAFTQTERKNLSHLNDQLSNINDKSQFDDTNLVSRSINEILFRERGTGHSISVALQVALLLTFITNFISMSLLTITPMQVYSIYINNKNGEHNDVIGTDVNTVVSLLMCLTFVLFIIFYGVNYAYVSVKIDKFEYMICLSGFVFGVELASRFTSFKDAVNYYIMFALVFIAVNLLMDNAVYFYTKFVPSDYAMMGVNGATFMQFIAMGGMFVGCLASLVGFVVDEKGWSIYKKSNWIFVFHMLFLVVGCIVLIILRNVFKEKAIWRIIRKKDKQQLRRTEF